ncbi:MAG: flavodoxin [Lactobacillus kalixensis]|uniref:flavodoxin n=1 Tax=Lactobacillus kalixensis TaxID=227944 RepID=UPI0039940ECD
MKVLITYYSWSGNTKRLADEIAREIPANTEIEIKVPAGTFSEDMYGTFDISKKQIAENNYPEINKMDFDPNDYDLTET